MPAGLEGLSRTKKGLLIAATAVVAFIVFVVVIATATSGGSTSSTSTASRPTPRASVPPTATPAPVTPAPTPVATSVPTPPPTPPPTAPPPPAPPPANDGQITAGEFSQIQTGMTYDQVKDIVGGPGELMSDSSVAGYSGQVYKWDGEGSLGANAIVQFQNGQVIQKAQFGLQ